MSQERTPIAAQLLLQQGSYTDFIGRIGAAYDAVREAEAMGDAAVNTLLFSADPVSSQERFNVVNHARYVLHEMAMTLAAYKALLISERPSV